MLHEFTVDWPLKSYYILYSCKDDTMVLNHHWTLHCVRDYRRLISRQNRLIYIYIYTIYWFVTLTHYKHLIQFVCFELNSLWIKQVVFLFFCRNKKVSQFLKFWNCSKMPRYLSLLYTCMILDLHYYNISISLVWRHAIFSSNPFMLSHI